PPSPAGIPERPPPAPGAVVGSRRAYFAECGGYVEVPVHTRASLPERLPGPAIVEDAESTIVVPPSWTAAPAPAGAVHLTRGGRA
ncbi:hydantoinase/oxoprolinase family protein, partial [Nonomuraea sp. AD125B]